MTMASGAHVSIGGVEYMLAVDEEPHYTHRFESLFSPTTSIAGEIAKAQIRPEKLLWSLTDFIGGEGGVIYYPDYPTQYDQASLMNVTKRGQLTTRTKRRRSSVDNGVGSATTRNERPAGVSAYTNAFIAWGDNILTSDDCISWSIAQDNAPASATDHYSDAISDGTNAAFLPLTTPNFGDSIAVIQADVSTATWADAHNGTVPDAPIVGCVVDGLPYTMGFNASSVLVIYKKAAVMDTAADWSATTIYNTAITPAGTWGTNFWTSATAAETASYWSYSTKTHGFIWEVKADVGRPFWTAPVGFCIKKLIYHMGILFAIGSQAAAGNAFATIWAIPLSTQTPLIAAEPRRHQNTTLSSFEIGCAANGPYIFAADANSGKIFLYDIQNDALSLFDDLANGGTGDGMSFAVGTDILSFLAMHGARLFGATHDPGSTASTLQVFAYDDLEVQNRDASQAISATLESAEWDFGLPMELKALIGFYITFKVTDGTTTSGLVANSRIKVSYSTDDSTYTDMTVITSASTPTGAKGRVFQQVSTGSSTVKFSRLKVKITLDNNSQNNVAPPILYGVTVEAQPMAYAETWDLLVRVEDEDQNERPSSRQNYAGTQRDNLEDLATNKNIVTFLDGYRDRRVNSYTTHTVAVEDPVDNIKTVGEGVMRVKLRAIV